MVKLIVVFSLALMVYAAIAQEGGDVFITGNVGEWTPVLCEANQSPCNREKKCCAGLRCYIDGKCGKVEKRYSKDGREIEVLPGIRKWAYYDACDSDLGRVNEACTTDGDCCNPMVCNSNKCSINAGLLEPFAYLRGF